MHAAAVTKTAVVNEALIMVASLISFDRNRDRTAIILRN